MALLDNGAQVKYIMPKYISNHSLQVGPITDLMGSKVTCVGLGNAYTRLLGYVVIWVQVDRVQGYNEDQIALVIPDLSNFMARVPVILGTPTIGQVVNVMKEAEMDALVMLWANARVAHLLSVHRMMPTEVGNGQEEKDDMNDYDQLMYTQNAENIEPFSSRIVPVKTGRAYRGECINVMVQTLQTEDGSLPQGLTVQNTYNELRKGSKKQSWWYRITQHTHKPSERKPQWPGGLDSWTPKLADAACQLLAKNHDVFSLDPAELGCTHSTKHIIKVNDDTPFKEQFR